MIRWGPTCGLGLVALFLASIFLSASAHPEVVGGLAIIALVGMLVSASVHREDIEVAPALFGLLLALLLGSVIQWIPIPSEWIALMSPETIRQLAMSYRGMEQSQYATWSLAPAISFHRTLQFFALLLCFLWGSLMMKNSSRGERHYRAEFLFIQVALLIWLGIVALQIFEYRPFEYEPSADWRGLGPFINPNHGGGFCALMAMWSLHSAQKLSGAIRWLGVTLAFGFCALVLLSLSRGAILALALGFCFAIAIPVISRPKLSRASMFLGGGIAILFCCGMVLEREYLLPVVRELLSLKTETGATKTTPWRGVPELLWMFPFGTGLGGLYAVLPQLNLPLMSSGRIFFLENQPLQVLTDWGLVLGSGIFLGFLAVMKPLAKRGIIHSNPFFFAGLVVVFCHNLVDFNSSLFSVQLLLVLGVTSVLRRHRTENAYFRLKPRFVISATILFSTVAAFGWSRYGHEGMPRQFKTLVDELEKAKSPTGVEKALHRYKIQHPMDVFADLFSARKLAELKAPREKVLARVNVAMNLQPHYAQPHLLASHLLLRYGARKQALGEYFRALGKNEHVTWTSSGSHFKSLASARMAKRAGTLSPHLRYRLWSRLRSNGVYLPEVIRDDESWLERPEFIGLRAQALLDLDEPREVLESCQKWEERYPALQACEKLRLQALERLGLSEQALEGLRVLWEKNRQDGQLATAYFSRLSGRAGCQELLRLWDSMSASIKFDRVDEITLLKRVFNCVEKLDYRNRFLLMVDQHLNDDSVERELLQHILGVYARYRPVMYTRACTSHRSRWSRILGEELVCP